MVPVPGTAARSVWICRQATRLACVSICPGPQSPSMSFTSFSLSTRAVDAVRRQEVKRAPERRRTRCIWLKDKHAWSNRQKARFAELKRRNLKTHRGFRFQETLRELFHSAQSTAQAKPLPDRWYSWARRCRPEPIKAVAISVRRQAGASHHDLSQIAMARYPHQTQESQTSFARCSERSRRFRTRSILETASPNSWTSLTASSEPVRRHCSRNPKWGPSDFGCEKLGDGHGLRRPTFVLRPSRRALRSSLTFPRFPVLLLGPDFLSFIVN